MNNENPTWTLVVHRPKKNKNDGLINLPKEISKKISGKRINYSLEKDRSIVLHTSNFFTKE